MAFRFNPLAFSGFDIVDEGGNFWGSPVATEGDLPAVGDVDGQARVVLDTDHIYVWDLATAQWIDTGFTTTTFNSTPTAEGVSLTQVDKGNNVTERRLALHAADATNPGGVSTVAQTFSGNKTFANNVTVDGDLLVSGTTTTINTTNLTVEDNNITINFGGSDLTAEGSGLTVERDVSVDGSLLYDSSLASRFKIGDLASESEVLTAGHVQTITANKTMSGTLTMSALTATRPMKLNASGEVISGLIDVSDNTNDVTGVLNIANGGTALSTVPTNGQLLVGNGTDYTLATLTPTANQTTVANGVGSITIGTVQDIATTSSPEFAGLTLTGFSGVVKAAAGVLSASLIVDADVSATAAINATKIHDGSVDNTEFGYLDGVTSSIQTQLDAKLDDFASTNDNRLVRTDGVTGEAVQESVVTLSDTGDMSGIAQLDAQVINALSTTEASISYPKMTEIQRDALTPVEGQGIYNTDTDRLNVYDGTQWTELAITSPGDVSETPAAFVESAANLGIFTLDSQVRAAKVYLSLHIDALSDLAEFYEMDVIYDGTQWYYSLSSVGTTGVSVDLNTATGEIRYTSSTYGGFTAGEFKYRVMSTTI